MTPEKVAHITPPLPFAVFDEFGKSCEDRVADHYRAAVEAALRDAPQAEGWVMVPVEPTNEMVFEGAQCGEVLDYDLAARIYRAVLSARPSAPTAVKPDELHDFTTHRASWRKAIEHLAQKDDSGYWPHELKAYDKAMAAFDRASKGMK